jgi:hypothetical protein
MTRQPQPGPDRVQTGVRMERRLVKVLKAVAELRDLSLGELLEIIAHDVFAGRLPFDEAGLSQVRELLAIYGVAPAAPAAPTPEDQP